MNDEKFKVVDLAYLKEMADGEESIIKEMIDIFKSQVDEFIIQMKDAQKAGQWMALSQVAHKAKSSIAIMGMAALADELNELELKAKKGENIDEYSKYIAKFEEQCNMAVVELNTLF